MADPLRKVRRCAGNWNLRSPARTVIGASGVGRSRWCGTQLNSTQLINRTPVPRTELPCVRDQVYDSCPGGGFEWRLQRPTRSPWCCSGALPLWVAPIPPPHFRGVVKSRHTRAAAPPAHGWARLWPPSGACRASSWWAPRDPPAPRPVGRAACARSSRAGDDWPIRSRFRAHGALLPIPSRPVGGV